MNSGASSRVALAMTSLTASMPMEAAVATLIPRSERASRASGDMRRKRSSRQARGNDPLRAHIPCKERPAVHRDRADTALHQTRRPRAVARSTSLVDLPGHARERPELVAEQAKSLLTRGQREQVGVGQEDVDGRPYVLRFVGAVRS